MKKFLTILGATLMMFATVSCNKTDSDSFPPYYRIDRAVKSTSFGTKITDFSNILRVVDQHINTDLKSESEAVSLYNDILSKTKDAEYAAYNGSYVTISIARYTATREDEHTIQYSLDNSYKSPVSHTWDEKGSRDE